MDKEKVFIGVQLEEIKKIAKDNGRNIADNSLRLMGLTDDVKDIKQEVRSMSEIIVDTQNSVNDLIKLNKEMREDNKKIGLILSDMMEAQKEMREIMDKWKEKDREYLKVGAM